MIKAKYNSTTTLIEGYFPDNISYSNNTIDTNAQTIDGDPYIEITEQEHKDNMGKTMCVISDTYQEYTKTTAELLAEAQSSKCGEISQIRDQKILEDSIRDAEAQTGDSDVMALTTVEDVEAYDPNTPFS